MCLSKQNYFSSSPSPHPRRSPPRTSVEDWGNFARTPRTPVGRWVGSLEAPEKGARYICMYANFF